MSIISRIRAPHASLSRYPPAAPLLLDGAHDPRPHGLAPFPDGEAALLLEPDGLDELDLEADVVPGHDHLDPRGQAHHPGDVRRPEVELGPVAGEEGGVPAPLLLREDVALRLEDGVGGDGAGLGDDLPPLHLPPPPLTPPRPPRPVPPAPRPAMVKTSSIGMRKGLSRGRGGRGMALSTAAMSWKMAPHWAHLPSPQPCSSALSAEPRMMGIW